jgi:hypothetical protein
MLQSPFPDEDDREIQQVILHKTNPTSRKDQDLEDFELQ